MLIEPEMKDFFLEFLQARFRIKLEDKKIEGEIGRCFDGIRLSILYDVVDGYHEFMTPDLDIKNKIIDSYTALIQQAKEEAEEETEEEPE